MVCNAPSSQCWICLISLRLPLNSPWVYQTFSGSSWRSTFAIALVNSVFTSSTSLSRSESYRLSRFVDAMFLLFFLFSDADVCVRGYKSFQTGIGGRSSFLTCKGASACRSFRGRPACALIFSCCFPTMMLSSSCWCCRAHNLCLI